MRKNKNMKFTEKVMKKIMDIIKVDGFYIVLHGDISVGIFDAEWKLSNNFYFDNQKEVDNFKEELLKLFDNYCGEVSIETFNERIAQIEAEDKEMYESYPVRYLIKDGDNFKQTDSIASYGSSIGDGIHFELPNYMSEDSYNGHDMKIINSKDPEFRKILLKEVNRLENEIKNEEYTLMNAKRNLALIEKELKYGK